MQKEKTHGAKKKKKNSRGGGRGGGGQKLFSLGGRKNRASAAFRYILTDKT
jgi:hypothetical protein